MIPKFLGRDFLFVSAVAGVTALALLQIQFPTKHALDTEPYAAIEIIPDSLVQRPVLAGGTEWSLFYSIRILQAVACDDVVVERFLHKLDDPFPYANNRDVLPDQAKPSSRPIVMKGHQVHLGAPLGPGNYFFLMRSSCNIADPTKPGKRPVGLPAESYVCFQVPELPTETGNFIRRLQPVSENCRRELSEVAVARPSQRLVMRPDISSGR